MEALTDDIYWASKSPAINQARQATQNGTFAAKLAAFSAIAASGMNKTPVNPGDLVDVPIMVWGWGPVLTMQLRQQDGYAWVPSALAPPVEVAPGIVVPGLPTYTSTPTSPYDIKVSLDATDYPVYKA